METLQMLQQITPAVGAFAVLALPYATLLVMHIVEAATKRTLDDTWQARAGAALRWSSTVARPHAARAMQLPLARAA